MEIEHHMQARAWVKLYASQGKEEKEVEEQYKKCIEIAGDRSAHARLELRKLYASQGKSKEAEEQYKKCIEIVG